VIDRLVHGLALGSELRAEEILDVLWLTATFSASQEARADEPDVWIAHDRRTREESLNAPQAAPTVPFPQLGDAARETDPGGGTDPPGGSVTAKPVVPLRLGGGWRPNVGISADGRPDDGAPVPATEVGFPTPRPIRDPLTVPLALRRLRKLQTPGPDVTVDIDVTVGATAEAGGRLMTVLTRPLRRALDLALVIDGAASMDMWADTFDELEHLLAQTGAFHSVSRWTLRASGDSVLLEARGGAAQPPGRLIDPSGKRLVLLATDGRDDSWFSPGPWEAIAGWSAAMPTALLQVLPEHYWPTTAVGEPYITATALRPTAPNNQYLCRLAWWASDPGGIPLPVVTLSPRAMEEWAQVVAGGAAWTTGITATPPDPEYAPSAARDTDARVLVSGFFSRASLGAQRLARILASAETLSMPLIEVLQDRLAPETDVLERAEVLASGLLTRTETVTPGRQVRYGYRPGVRGILKRGTTTFETWDAYTAVSQYLADRQRLGGPLHALVADPAGGAALDVADEPFAALRQTLAIRLGLSGPAVADRAASLATREQVPGVPAGSDEADNVLRGQASDPLLDQSGQPLLDSAAEFQPEEVLTPAVGLKGESEFIAALRQRISGLRTGEEFSVAEFRRADLVNWRIFWDARGRPSATPTSVGYPADPAVPTGKLHPALRQEFERLSREWVSRLLATSPAIVVVSKADVPRTSSLLAYGAAARACVIGTLFDHLAAAGEPAYASRAKVAGLLEAAIAWAPLPTSYELVVLSPHRDGTLTLTTEPLFGGGAVPGDRTEIQVQCQGTDGRPPVFAVVSVPEGVPRPVDPDAIRARTPLAVRSALPSTPYAVRPERVTLRAELGGHGEINLALSAGWALRADSRSWRDIMADVSQWIRERQVRDHLICLLEVTGGPERVEYRANALRRFLELIRSGGRPSAVSLVTYGTHSSTRLIDIEPARVRVRAAEPAEVIGRLRDLDVDHGTLDTNAQLECALAKVVNEELTGEDGRPILVTVADSVPRGSIDATCQHGRSWRSELAQLRVARGFYSIGIFGPRVDEQIRSELTDRAIDIDDSLTPFSRTVQEGLRVLLNGTPLPLVADPDAPAEPLAPVPTVTPKR
jgi:hypothetical protein